MDASRPSILAHLFPQHPNRPPIHVGNMDSSKWITAAGQNYRVQIIDCSYPISGNYGRVPRYFYYALIFLSLVARRRSWVVDVALGSVMTYSGTSAIHAMILAAIRTQLVPQSIWKTHETIQFPSSPNASLPIIPMAWDADQDTVLATAGVAFLVVAPIQIFSRSLSIQEPQTTAIFFIWTWLLASGLACACLNGSYINYVSFPQFRFCPLDESDILPFTTGGRQITSVFPFSPSTPNYWNKTITAFFDSGNSTLAGVTCIYPCFSSAPWLLRDPGEITAHEFFDSVNGNDAYMYVMFAIYFIVFFTALTTVTIFIIRRSTRAWELRPQSFRALAYRWIDVFRAPRRGSKALHAVWSTWLFWTVLYTKLFSLVSLLLFAGLMEWTSSVDVQGEDYQHVGQWGPIVAGGLVIVSAVMNVLWPVIGKQWVSAAEYLSNWG